MRVLQTLAAALLLATPVQAYAPDVFAVCHLNPNGDNFLALRSGPGSSHPMRAKLGPGTKVWDWERRGKWYRVSVGGVNGPEGWVYADYLCLIEDH
ncbi:SH3 domain-containing protein [Pseudooceanicola nanhaiensis]|uniref:SH3 domain-containing protein n=1 Tax=Pseudooceanicola nanhaiensis TaxID=375761 RepID=UPI001CD49C34|nr:SH3 domain-containing protein [Pseudooceanicola nanhaiensis]MCA0921126.1 SH3 domain-containing protein [Pseudooceanicola nanhaiensis]